MVGIRISGTAIGTGIGMTTGTAIGTRIGTWTDKIVLSESKHEKNQLI